MNLTDVQFKNSRKNWLRTILQLWISIAHFLVASFKARYTDFNTASSVGKDILFWVYFRIFPLRFSIKLVV